MRRRTAPALLVLAYALLSGCGGPDEPGGRPPEDPPPLEAPRPFHLEVTAPGTPGRRPAIRVTGDPAEVTVSIRRAGDPSALVPFLADPSLDPTELETTGPPTSAGAGSLRDLPALPAGLYLVTARRGELVRRALLPVADLAVHVLRSPTEILVFAADRATGRPARGVPVVAGRDLLRVGGTTDATGVFRTALRAGPAVGVVVGDGERLGFATAGAVPAPVEEPAEILRTDREIAHPGDRVRFGLLRKRPGDPVVKRFRVETADGLLIAAGDLEDGEPVGAFAVPEEAPAGPAVLTVTGPELETSTAFRIAERAPSPLELTVTIPSRTVRGETVPVEVAGRYDPGGRAAGAPVAYSAWLAGRQGRPALEGRGVLDAGGVLRTRFVPGEAGTWILRVVSDDGTGRPVTIRREIDVRAAAFTLSVAAAKRWVRAPAPIRVRLDAAFPDGSPETVTGSLRVGEEERPFAIEPGDRTVLAFDAPGPGEVDVIAVAEDAQGREVKAGTSVRVVAEDGAEPGDGLVAIPDRDSYRPGERARVLVLLPFDLEGASVLTVVEGDRIGTHAVQSLSGPVQVVEVPVPPALGREASFRVVAATAGGFREAAATFRVGEPAHRIRAALELYREDDGPGALVRARDRDGEPIPARALLAVRAGDEPIDFRVGVPVPREGARIPLAALLGPGRRVLAVDLVTMDGRRARETMELPAPAGAALDLVLPPFLVEGDVAVLRAAAGRVGAAAAAGRLRLTVDGLEPLGPSEVALSLPADGDRAEAEWTVSASRHGTARVEVALMVAGETTTASGEIPVIARTTRELAQAAGRATGEGDVGYVTLPAGFRAGPTIAALHLSASPLGAARLARDAAANGDPGDAEDLLGRFLTRVVTLAALDPDGVRTGEVPVEVVALAARQRPDGGWGFAGDASSDPAATARIVRGLVDLRGAGPILAGPDLDRAADRLRRALAEGRIDPDTAAEVTAALRILGDTETPAPALRPDELRPAGAAALAEALGGSGDWAAAVEVAKGLLARGRRLPDGRTAWGDPEALAWGSEPVTATAAVLRAVATLPGAGDRERADRAVRFLLESRSGAGWDSPRRTGAAVAALLAAREPGEAGEPRPVSARIRVGEAIAASVRHAGPGWAETIPVPGRTFRPGQNRITLEKAGQAPLDWSLSVRAAVPSEGSGPEDRGIAVTRTLFLVGGSGGAVSLSPADEGVRRGDRLLTALEIRSVVPRRRVIVRVPLPAGTTATAGDPASLLPARAAPPGVRVRRTDREIVFFVPGVGPGGVRLAFLSRATVSGRFTALPARATLSDHPRVRGTTGEAALSVE